jgi:hypothetical protein
MSPSDASVVTFQLCAMDFSSVQRPRFSKNEAPSDASLVLAGLLGLRQKKPVLTASSRARGVIHASEQARKIRELYRGRKPSGSGYSMLIAVPCSSPPGFYTTVFPVGLSAVRVLRISLSKDPRRNGFRPWLAWASQGREPVTRCSGRVWAMTTTRIPDSSSLAEATVEPLHKGVSDSDSMRQQLAARSQLGRGDQTWRKFVNNHAWALVRLQAQGRIRKFAPGRHELAVGEPDGTAPIRDGEPLPKWARVLVSGATQTNATRWPHAERFNKDDLIELWRESKGRCMMTGLRFKETPVGNGRARRPFAPSLDRIDSSLPYSRRNCRLVLQAVTFALNAWGDDVFLTIAEGAIKFRDAPEKLR